MNASLLNLERDMYMCISKHSLSVVGGWSSSVCQGHGDGGWEEGRGCGEGRVGRWWCDPEAKASRFLDSELRRGKPAHLKSMDRRNVCKYTAIKSNTESCFSDIKSNTYALYTGHDSRLGAS